MQWQSMAAVVPVLLATLGVAAAASAQRVWVVDWNNGPGTDFVALQPAVDAAAPGDVIQVRGAGIYPFNPQDHGYPAPVIDGKGITILGEGAATTWISGTMRILNVPASQQMTVAQVRCGTEGEGALFQPVTVEVTQCRGVVSFRSVVMAGHGFRPLTDCDLVIVSGCELRPVCGLRPVRSNLMLDGVMVAWDPIYQYPSPAPPWGSPLDAIRSKVWIVNSYLWGQSDIPGVTNLSYYRPGGYTEDADIWIGPGTTIEGGVSLQGFRHAFWDRYQPLPGGTYAVPPSRYHRDPGAQIFGAFPWSAFNPVYVAPVTAAWAIRTGNTLVVEQRCKPSSGSLLVLGPYQFQPIAGIPAPLCLAVDQSWQSLALAPTTGSFATSFAIPPGLPLGLQVCIQMGVLTPANELQLSNVTVFGIF
jgi:hypothetical protein